MRKICNDWRLAVRMLCALALVFVAFAHKPITTAYADPIDLAAYTLPDGTVPVLCLPRGGDQDQHKSAWHGTGCEACRLSASFILPVPPVASGPKVQPAKSLAIQREAILIAHSLYPPSAPPRAPPFA
ncbi:hypothetical protein CU102_17320 [Phyllobacterium brassicacearum]|uniref:DUF2946 domain-containing protein n=1 Tax=Phyllobacterium brassicacearum TaxID=314235 RepID=A0A2P7BMH8_9HYPH|nr:hypothetical protein [Phyllobacterium brassicacearum]PSH67646.1 hypothetical protein CU102_17320 [Phyllobacterium brassicacearum]TDQ25884.1 hypothetical protein DEV91_11360 [Phyllobacterium brassicacearum]